MPIGFKYSKTKECLAHLIDHQGALCAFGKLRVVIFEDDGHERYMKSLRRDLLETLDAAGKLEQLSKN